MTAAITPTTSTTTTTTTTSASFPSAAINTDWENELHLRQHETD